MDALSRARAHPWLAQPDIQAAIAWYAGTLGFDRTQDYGDFGIAARGDIGLNFWLCDSRHIAENTSCYITVRDVGALDALFSEFKSRGDAFAPGRISPVPQDFDYGMREFYVWDPAGNLLRFGAALEQD
ncbi:MAG: VOC family protein [Euryhalocaulis sp.]|uniref:bleomycin resistance protein n=1 Tax=Euryhalocaulis sp. TaxID=2744307 RepID=UPI00183B2A70|nr:VOC family protein [Euryhalocaulis sp.]MBA4802053.1 VOC family protein [Euryhalocaulis sp.]